MILDGPRKEWRTNVVVLSGIVLANLVFFRHCLFAAPYFRDFYHEYHPLKIMLREALLQGRAPLWNPYQYLGGPYLGSVFTGVFYPGSVIFFFLDALSGLTLLVLLHYPLAGMGMFLFLRGLKINISGALTAAVAYMWSGYLVSQHSAVNMLPFLALFPFSWWMARKALSRSSSIHAAAAGILLALILLGGDPQGFVITAGVVLLDRLLPDPDNKAGPRIRLKQAGLIIIAGLALSMVQLLPALETARASYRGHGFDLDSATCWSFHPARMIEWIAPDFFGRVWTQNTFSFWGGRLTQWCFPVPMALSVYLGIWPLLAALAALGRVRQKSVYMLGGLAGLGLLLALGRYSILYRLAFQHLPGFSVFRYPEKYLELCTFGLCGLAGFGTHYITDAARSGRRVVEAVAAGAALFALLGAASAVAIIFRQEVLSFLNTLAIPGAQGPAADSSAAFRAALSAVQRGLLASAAALLIAYLLPRLRNHSALLLALPVLFTGVDLLLANDYLMPTSKAVYQNDSEAAGVIRKEMEKDRGLYRFVRDKDWPAAPIARAELSPMERERLWQEHTLKPNRGIVYHLEEMFGLSVSHSARMERFINEADVPLLWPMYNVKYFIAPFDTDKDARPSAERVVFSHREWNYRIVSFDDAFPRAYYVPAAAHAFSEDQALRLLNDTDLHKVVILEGAAVEAEGRGPLIPAKVVTHEPERVTVEVENAGPGYLVLNDAFYPGWRATVNGGESPIYRANFLVRAVHVDRGKNIVEFVYRPLSYVLGKWISLVALALFILAALWHNRAKEKVETSQS